MSDCLIITSSAVSVDCAHHIVNGIVTISSGTSDVSVLNCVIPVGFRNPSNITSLTIANSIISNILLIRDSRNAIIRGNQISVTGRPGAVVSFSGGSGNQVLDNVLDGGYHGHDLTGQGADASGADDGIILENETSDTVQGNTIMNVFDAGIEGVDSVTGTTIAGNTITGAIFAGVSSYWCTHWQGDAISTNTISQAVQAIRVTYTVGSLCNQSPGPPGLFADNTIAGNVLHNQLVGGTPAIGILLPSIADMVTNNLIRGNDVGTGAISLTPLAGFTNGGGNVCGPSGNFGC